MKKTPKTNLKVGDRVQVTGSGAWETPEPVKITDFGFKDGKETASLDNGSWAYTDELVKR